uniref:uncharacterized protein LOC117611141 n=1 Tax=Osmia lignaria TaxID=473952 RepID=UPI00147978CE|nr:uncharacterized protein LOC117611141 [Osmia lignaria]
MGIHTIIAKVAVRYLGVLFDSKRTFWAQIWQAADRAAATASFIAPLMANIGGLRPAKRGLLMTSVESVLLYGAEIWAGVLRFEKYRRRLAAVQRRCALRVACSYRTVAEPAVLVIAGMLPIDLLAVERKQVYEAKRSGQDRVDAKRVT